MADPGEEWVQVLAVEPEFGEQLDAPRAARARRELVARVRRLPAGEWQPDPRQAPPAGFLVLNGCLTREVAVLGQTEAIDLLAQGDLVRPSQADGLASVASTVRWQVLEPSCLAVLDRDFLLAAQRWPEVMVQLLERQERRAQWLANVLATSHLPSIDLRIRVLFWQFADRWGSVRGGEVLVPIPLTHLNIARLVGARRPTVTTALNRLVDAGLLFHEQNGQWVLRGGPPLP